MIKRTKSEWLKLIEDQKASGLSAAEFCRRNKVDAKYFSLRRRELTKAQSSFVEVAASVTNGSKDRINVRVTEFSVPMSELRGLLF